MTNESSTWNIETGGGIDVWVAHIDTGGFHYFVGRFRYFNPKLSARHFIKFLCANFTPEEYFARLKAGESPLVVLESKGFISYNKSKAK